MAATSGPPKRIALRVAYEGTSFSGSQRQPGERTVEGDLLAALARVHALEDPAEGGFQAAGRTDKGVSAAGNVFAFDTAFPPRDLPGALNAHLSDAWVTGWAEVPPGFNPRHARRRTYRYFLPGDAADPEALRAAGEPFVGEHDFSSFARVEAGRNPVRRVTAFRVREAPPFLAVDVEGGSFLWNQVRRMVAAAVAVARGEVTLERVEAALAGKVVEDFGVAPPEPLVLVEVAYDFEFTLDEKGTRDLDARLGARERNLALALARTRLFRP